jgi:hypothetical protein
LFVFIFTVILKPESPLQDDPIRRTFMAARQHKDVKHSDVNRHDIRRLENALTVARAACALFKSKVPYAGHLYDAAEDVIHACEQMEKEARDA